MDFLANILKCLLIVQLIFIKKSIQSGCRYPPKLQIVFLVDGSLSPSSNWSVIQTEITKEVTKLTQEKYFPYVEFGLAAYYTWKDDNTKCYTLIQPLSPNPNDMLAKLELPGEAGNDVMTSECSMSMALLLTVKDEMVKWDNSGDDNIKKLIIAYTLKPSVTQHTKGKIADLLFRRDAIGDGTDTCDNSYPPKADVLRKVLEENKVMALMEIILPFTREGTVGHFYSRTEGSPFYYFRNEVTCAQYYGRVNTVTALSNYWAPDPALARNHNHTITDKYSKHILQVGPGIREEDIKHEDMLKRAKILFNKCFMRRICLAESESRTVRRTHNKNPMSENYKFAGKHQSTKLIWKSTSNCTGDGKPLQIAFLVDAALPKGSKWPVIQQEMTKEMSMILQERDASTEFALVAYFNWKDMKGKCYCLLQPFTTNSEEILSKIASLEGGDEPLQDSKCSMTMALVLSLHDPELKWSEDKQKILIAFPLRPSHSSNGSPTEMAPAPGKSSSAKTKSGKSIHDKGPRWKVYFHEDKKGSGNTAVAGAGAGAGAGAISCDDGHPPSAEELKQVVTEKNAFVIVATFLPNSLEEVVGHSYSAGDMSPFKLFSNELMCASWYSQNNSMTARPSLWNPDQWQETIPVVFPEIMGLGLVEDDIKPENMTKRALFLIKECFIRNPVLCTNNPSPPPSTPNLETKPGALRPMQKPGTHNPMQKPGTHNPMQKPGTHNPMQKPGTHNPMQNPGTLQPMQKEGNRKQVVFMVDASLSKTSKWPVIQQEMVKEVTKLLHFKEPTMEFALVAYYSWKELKGQCYSLLQGFTTNVEEILTKIATLSGGEDVPSQDSKCSLTMALVMAIKDSQLLWSNDKNKVIVGFPLRGSHVEHENAGKGAGFRRSPLGDGTDTCENSLAPSAEIVRKVVTENKVWVIIATFLPNSLEEVVGHSYGAGETSPLHLLSTELVCAQWYSHNNSVTARASLWKPDQWQESIPIIFHGIMGPGLKEEEIKAEDMKKRAAFLVWNCFNKKYNEPEVAATKVVPVVPLQPRMDMDMEPLSPSHTPMAAEVRTEEGIASKGKKAQGVVEEEVCILDDSELPNLQILFLVDGSLAHGSNWSRISQDMTKEMSTLIAEKQKKSGASVEFAVASYFSSHGDQTSGGKCYSLLQPFTKDSVAIIQKIGELGHSHTDVYAECSLTMALFLAVKDKSLHWNDELITVDNKATRKFIVVYPMRVSSITSGGSGGSGAGAKREPIGDGTDTCENSKPPSAEALKQMMYTNNVYLLIGTFLLQGKEEQVGKFYSTDQSSPFRLFSGDTACFMYYGAQNSITGRRNAWMNNKMTLSSKTFKFATSVGLGFKEDTIEDEDIVKRASLLYQNCFLPEFTSCDWEDPPGYNTMGL